MAATAENLAAFLTKRGFAVEVSKNEDNNTFAVAIKSPTMEAVAALLAQIAEPGRFVVSVQLTDISDILVEPAMEEIQRLREDVYEEARVLHNVQEGAMRDRMSLRNTQQEAEEHERKTFEGVSQRIDRLDKSLADALQDIATTLEALRARPWWKKWRQR